jgi:hypothetical protein
MVASIEARRRCGSQLSGQSVRRHEEALVQARQLAEVLLAVVAIWHLASAIPSISFLISAMKAPPSAPDSAETFQVASLTASIASSLLIGTALLVWRARIAERLVPASEPVPRETPPWQAAAFAVLGVYFFIRGVSGAVPFVVAAGFTTEPVWELIADDLVQAVLGLALFFGAPGLSVAWHRLRTAGRGERAA